MEKSILSFPKIGKYVLKKYVIYLPKDWRKTIRDIFS